MDLAGLRTQKVRGLNDHTCAAAVSPCRGKRRPHLPVRLSPNKEDGKQHTRVARNELPWVNREIISQPQRGCSTGAPARCNPVGVDEPFDSSSQGSSSL